MRHFLFFHTLWRYWMVLLMLSSGLMACSPDADVLIHQGKQALDDAHFDEAVSTFSQAIEADPQRTDAYNARAVGYFELKQYDLALEDLNQAITLDSVGYRAYYNRANVYREQKNYESALQDYTRAIQRKPNVTDLYINRGAVYFVQNRYEEALQDFDFALQLDDQNPLLHFNQAKTLMALNRNEEALEAFSKTLTLDEKNGEAYYWSGILYAEEGQPEEGCLMLRKAQAFQFEKANAALETYCSSQ